MKLVSGLALAFIMSLAACAKDEVKPDEPIAPAAIEVVPDTPAPAPAPVVTPAPAPMKDDAIVKAHKTHKHKATKAKHKAKKHKKHKVVKDPCNKPDAKPVVEPKTETK
jgi:monoamine oxidase